jgi:type IV secretion system protein VirD4
MRLKILFVIILACLAVVLGLYISGALYQYNLVKSMTGLGLTSYWNAYNAYDLDSSMGKKIQSYGSFGFGLAGIIWFFLVYKIFENNQSLYGDARFASISEIRSQGLFKNTPDSIIVGHMGGKYLYYGGQRFALLAAPTRSGKGVGIVIPNLLTYSGSCVVLDIKQENFDLTSGFRQQHGHEVFLFNPFAVDGRTHRWNPLSYISNDPKFRVSDLSSIAAMLFPSSVDGKDSFWKNHAQNVFIAFGLYLFESKDFQASLGCPEDLLPPVTLGAMYRMSSAEDVPIKEHLQALLSMNFVSAECRTAFGGILSQNDEVFSSILGTFKEPLLPWLNPVVDAATSSNDFLLTDLRKKKMTIYIGILPNKLAESKLIINLFFSQLINENTKELPQANPALKYQCLLLMDEFTSIGRIDIISKAVSFMAGYNLRLLPIVQSLAQLDSVYGKEDSRTLVTNHALQIIYTPRMQSDANDYSEMLGYLGVNKQSVSKGKDVSKTQSDEKRALMLPQEIKALSMEKEILIFEGLSSPVLCDKIFYFKDKAFKSRLLPKANVPVIL